MKEFLVKLTIFLAIIFVAQSAINQSSLPGIVTEEDPPNIILDQIFEEQVDILYLGDSTLFIKSTSDKIKYTTPQFLSTMFPEFSVVEYSHAAHQMDFFKEIVNYIIAKGYSPKIIIIPINMRSFSVSWDKQPGYQFELESQDLRVSSNFFLSPFTHFLHTIGPITKGISAEEFANTPVYKGSEFVGLASEFNGNEYKNVTDERMRKKIIFYYMYPLGFDHRKVQSMKEILQAAKGTEINILFYITPVDYLTGEEYLGEEFSQRLAENIEVIETTILGEGGTCINLAFALETSEFFWKKYPNEHLFDTGREFVAESLAQVIRSQSLLTP